MTRLTPILLGLTFVMSVVTMVLVLLLFVTKPWDDPITEAELSEILRAEQETSSEEKEAERVAKCQTVIRLKGTTNNRFTDRAEAEVFSTLMENRCLSSP